MWQAINIIAASLIGICVGAVFRRKPIVLLTAAVGFAIAEGALVFACSFLAQRNDGDIWVQLGNPLIAPAALVAACTGMGLAAFLLRDPEPEPFRSIVPNEEGRHREEHWRARNWTAVRPKVVEDAGPARPAAEPFKMPDRRLEEVRIEPQAPRPVPLAPKAPEGVDRGRRRQPRRRTVLRGLIVSGETTVPCVMRDLSTTGARLHLQSDTPLPRSITLVDRSNAIAHIGAIAWRDGREVGVRFERSIDLNSETAPEAAALRTYLR
jgi:hypothetical protein